MSDATPFAQPTPAPLRQCGRCRLFFPSTRVLSPAEMKEWWACDTCTTAIVPSSRRPDDD